MNIKKKKVIEKSIEEREFGKEEDQRSSEKEIVSQSMSNGRQHKER